MIALDTNVLLRHLYTRDDPAQSTRATALIEETRARGEVVYLTGIVLCELVWTLTSSFGLARAEIAAVLQRILAERAAPEVGDGAGAFVIESSEIVARAIDDYASGPADFSDYLIGHLGQAAGAATTYTFDRAAAMAATFKRVRAR